jgi:hypothetical protein
MFERPKLFGGKGGQQRQNQDDLNRMAKQFVAAVSRGEVGVLDRFGNKVDPGDKVVWHPPYDPVWDVVAIQPVLEQGAQPGAMQITFGCTVPMNLFAGMATMSMMLVQKAQPGPAEPAAPEPSALVDGSGKPLS